jgi:hypothetical protein
MGQVGARETRGTEGLLRKVNRELEMKLSSIEQRRDVSLDIAQLAAGVIFIE